MQRISLFFLLLFAFVFATSTFSKAQSVDSFNFTIAYNDGTVALYYKDIERGFNGLNGNFFTRTSNSDIIATVCGEYCLYEVVMGVFTDWLIPAVNSALTTPAKTVLYSSKDVFTGGFRFSEDPNLRPYTYSPVSPFHETFNGYSRLLPYEWNGVSFFGSSPINYVKQGVRDRLNAWGSGSLTEKGGCCANSATDPNYSFGKPYTIYGHHLPMGYLYFRVVSFPAFYFVGQKIGVKALVSDIFMRTNVSEAVSNWTFKREDTFEIVNSMGSEFFYSFIVGTSGELSLTLNVTLSTSGRKFWPESEGNFQSRLFKLSKAVQIMSPSTPIDFNTPITKMLRFTDPENPQEVMTIKIDVNGENSKETDFFGSDVDITPKIGQSMSAFELYANKTFNWKWSPVSEPGGKFGGGVTKENSFQYFAFAIFNPVKQIIPVTVTCPKGAYCLVYVNGTLFNGTKPNAIIPSLEYTTFEKGWHQVIVKVASHSSVDSGFQISFEASGLAFNLELLTTAPFTISPSNETMIIPPRNETIIIPPNNETIIIPPNNKTIIIPPNNKTMIIPPTNKAFGHTFGNIRDTVKLTVGVIFTFIASVVLLF